MSTPAALSRAIVFLNKSCCSFFASSIMYLLLTRGGIRLPAISSLHGHYAFRSPCKGTAPGTDRSHNHDPHTGRFPPVCCVHRTGSQGLQEFSDPPAVAGPVPHSLAHLLPCGLSELFAHALGGKAEFPSQLRIRLFYLQQIAHHLIKQRRDLIKQHPEGCSVLTR